MPTLEDLLVVVAAHRTQIDLHRNDTNTVYLAEERDTQREVVARSRKADVEVSDEVEA